MFRCAYILVVLVAVGCYGQRHNSRMQQQWGTEARHFSHTYDAANRREGHQVVVINNEEYDLSEEEQSRMWELYLKKGYIPEDPEEEAPVASPFAAVAEDPLKRPSESYQMSPENYIRRQGVASTHHRPIKQSRFVADPDKQHLIQKVSEEEAMKLKQQATAGPPPQDTRVAAEVPPETSTVFYEYTQVPMLTFVWNEIFNLGDMLSREVVDTVTWVLQGVWDALTRLVQGRGLRLITGPS